MEVLSAYTDGGFNLETKLGSWAFIIVKNDEIIFKNKGIITDKETNLGFQVGAECQAVVESLKWAKENQVKLNVFYDFANLRFWLADIWGEKPWKTNKIYTIEYRKKVLELRENLANMVKVKAHAGIFGDKWNEFVDQYAKT
jgi:ribonuclease HI